MPSQNLTKPGGQEFALYDGVVVDVHFTYHNSVQGRTTLNVASTGAYDIMAYGGTEVYWKAGSTVRFVWTGGVWQCASVPVWASEVTVGNPNGFNFYTNGTKSAMRVGEVDYIRSDARGQQIGLDGRTHVIIDNDGMDIVDNGDSSIMHMGLASDGYPTISTAEPKGLAFTAGGEEHPQFFITADGHMYLNPHDLIICPTYLRFFSISDYNKALYNSIVQRVNGSDHLDITPTGGGRADGYAWFATNGDMNTQPDIAVIGTSAYNYTLRFHFNKSFSGLIRINYWGVPVPNQPAGDPPDPDGPEIIADPAGEEPAHDTMEEGDDAA